MVLLVAGIVAAAWYMVFDMFLMEPVIGSYLAGVPGMNAAPATMWIVVGNVVGGLVLAAVYARIRSIFGVGLKNGATYGVYAGVLINFPTWLFLSVFAGWPYGAAWAMTIASIVYVTIAGALIGLVYEKMGTSKPA